MAVYDSPPGAGPVTVLSPQQFHAQLEVTVRDAIAAGPEDGEEARRRLFGILQEVPSLSPGEAPPPFLASILVSGVRHVISRRRADAVADPDRLLADLMEFLLAFYPEAVPPLLVSDQLEPQ